MDKQTKVFIVIVAIIVVVMGIGAFKWSENMGKVDYLAHLDDTIFTVDETDYKLRDMAFYIAYSESNVESQAVTYNSEDTNSYWNAHINGKFLKLSAKEGVIGTAIHDVIFYEMALKDEIVLSAEEQGYLEGKKEDFWMDLTDEQKELIGVSQDEINEVMDKMALAQKEQQYIAGSEGTEYEEYDVEGDAYQLLLAKHTYKIKEELWKRVDFGNITLRH